MRQLKFGILEYLDGPSVRHEHKMNLLGTPSDPGRLERHMKEHFDDDRRFQADLAFQELLAAGLIRPTYEDMINPEKWVAIAPEGRRALERRALDALDAALSEISPGLVEMRDGAWAAVASRRADALRQAAHSARELIDQTLKLGAPDEAVRAADGFVADPSARAGVTRRHRLRHLMRKHQEDESESALRVADRACNLALGVLDRLAGMAHARVEIQARELEDALRAAEIALRHVLVPE